MNNGNTVPEITEEMAKRFLEEREQLLQNSNNIQPPVVNPPEAIPQAEEKITSLGKARRFQENEERHEYVKELRDTYSWKNIPKENLPSEGLYYPADTQIQIRAALVQEIRNFSTIDETDLIDIDDKLNMIIDKCARVVFNGQRVTYKDITELDRFYLVYSIREMTFKNGENKLQMNISCTECGNQDVIDIQKENFSFFTLPEKLKRFYDHNECAFVIKLKDTGEEFKIYMPTLGVTNFIKQYVRKRQSNNRNIDKAFLRISPFLFGNWRTLNDVKYDSTNEESFRWSFKKMSAVIGIIDMLQSAINPEITDTCTSCGTEVKAPISFQGGIKKLFLFTFNDNRDFFDEFV